MDEYNKLKLLSENELIKFRLEKYRQMGRWDKLSE